MIVKNAARCGKCGDVIESKHRHNFVSCTCGDIFVDGGRDYLRWGHREGATFINLSVTDDKTEVTT